METKYTDKQIEDMLLNNVSADDILQKKLTEEVEAEIFESKKIEKKSKEKKYLQDFNKVPEGKIFSKSCYYKLFNRINKREFLIDGVQVENFIGLNDMLYEKVRSKAFKAFYIDDLYIKFDRYLIK